MTLIVDASVAVKWFLAEPDSDTAERVLTRRVPLVAPDLIVAEIANVAWRLHRRGEVDVAAAHRMAGTVARYLTRMVPLPFVHERALEIAIDLDHPIYDCCYIALAEVEGARLLTADKRLLRRLVGSAYAGLVEPLTP